MLIPATVLLSPHETTLEVMDVNRDEATFLYAQCETCGWDSRQNPADGKVIFEASADLLQSLVGALRST